MPIADRELAVLLREVRRIAVVGLSPNPARPSHGVSAYMQRAGYVIIPVRPGVTSILGERAYPDLRTAAAAGPIDVVNVFRRSETIPELVDDCILLHPRLVWLQVGVRHDGAAQRLEAASIPVVMDRCLMVEHAHLVGP